MVPGCSEVRWPLMGGRLRQVGAWEGEDVVPFKDTSLGGCFEWLSTKAAGGGGLTVGEAELTHAGT